MLPPTALNPAFPYATPSIFASTSAAAAAAGAINLGQGFPEEDGPPAVKAAAADALLGSPQQYAHPAGTPALRAALAEHEAGLLGASGGEGPGAGLDPETQVLVTAGATEALAASILALVRPGDEVVLVDPAYDSYAPVVRVAGGIPIPIRLVPPPPPPAPPSDGDSATGATTAPPWALPAPAVVAALFKPGRTKLLILNTPHNPTGHVFSRAELEALAAQVGRCRGVAAGPTQCVALCDEVYAALALPPHAHASLATLPGMAGACLRVGSAGKTFSLTGWKVGWVTGPAPLVSAVAGAHQFLTFSVPGCLQAGVAHGLVQCRSFIAGLGGDLAAKRARLAPALAAAGFRVLPSEATYFLTADAAALMAPGEVDTAFCERLVKEAGVAAIPLSPFYCAAPATEAEAAAWAERGVDALQPRPPTTLVRFCFAKKDGTLDEAARRLGAYFGRRGA
jgi:aspartate/methionine/tyrosine aminotransferase